MSDLVLGIDVGTSGVRIAAIDRAGHVAAFATSTMPAPLRDGPRITQDPALWARALDDAMARLGSTVDLARIGALAVDGTSGTAAAVFRLLVPFAGNQDLALLSLAGAAWSAAFLLFAILYWPLFTRAPVKRG